jgi:hypothetical protein
MKVVIPTEKKCRRCNRVLPAECFDLRASASKGLRAWCRECESPDALKYCKRCETRKPLSEFHKRKDSAGTTAKGWCKSCQTIYMREYSLKIKYGLTVEAYDALWRDQYGLCAICEMEPAVGRLRVDHDHKTNLVRGLLCDSCNTGLGLFADNPDFLRIAADYLEGKRHEPVLFGC